MPSPTSKQPLRWSLEVAAREMDWNRDTLRKKLVQADQVPALDGTYSTRQLLTAIYGDIDAERLRKTKEEADNMALKNAILRGESLPKGLMTPAMEEVFIVVKQMVTASSMTTLEKRDLLNTIANWPVAVKNVAQKASKQIALVKEAGKANGNGEAEEAD
jgi:hypothetical protein